MTPLSALAPPLLCLPQADPDPHGRTSQIANARDTYRYTYDKPNVRGLAMCEQIPADDKPDPAWASGLAALTARLVANSAKEGGRPDPTQLDDLRRVVMAQGLAGALKTIGEAVVHGDKGRQVTRLGDYAALFHEWHPPLEAGEMALGSTFARMRLAGPNPGWIRRVDPRSGLPTDCGFTAQHYAAAIGDGDTLEAALSEGRLFLCEYRELLGLHPGSVPVPEAITVDYAKDPAAWDAAYKARERAYAQAGSPKALVAPLALFAVPAGARALSAVAIQLFPDGHGGQRHPVFTHRDGLAWTAAQACVHAADGAVHETISHLGRTHLVQEAFYLALRNNLSPRHPLHRLLVPHFQGTANINASADQVLVAPAGYVDELLMPTIGGAIQLTAGAVEALDFNAASFPQDLAARGVDSTDVLLEYPYRDDGRLVWEAIASWVTGYVQHHYRSDSDVAADGELQGMVREVAQPRGRDAAGRLCGGGIRGIGEDGPRVATRGYLIRMLTQIIWNGSAQHAAVNFPQGEPMTYAPHYPLALRAPVPASARVSEADYLAMLPTHQAAHVQLFVTKLLGSLYYSQLGHYPKGPGGASYFGPGPVAHHEEGFVRELARVEDTIRERNRRRPAYRYLLPSEIPQSINI